MERKIVKIPKSYKLRKLKAYEVPHSNYFHECRWKDDENDEWFETEYGYTLSNPSDERSDNLEETVETSNLVNDLPDEIWERIFTNVSRDDLDLCMRMCRKWHRVIEGGSERLTQRRVIYGLNFCRDPNARFWLEVTSQSGTTIRVADCRRTRQNGFYVFKNSILEKMNSTLNDFCVDLLKAYLKNLCNLGGERIPVKSFRLRYYPEDIGQLERFHHFFPYYVNAEELEMIITRGFILNKKFYKCLDFGPTTAVNIKTYFDFDSTNVPRDVPSFKEFVSGNFIGSPNLKKLEIDHSCNGTCFISIIEAFCETTEPSKFFKEIDIPRCDRFRKFDRIAKKNGFNLQMNNVYSLGHPKLKWALEAIFFHEKFFTESLTLKLKIMEID